jgi:hypothetical protein
MPLKVQALDHLVVQVSDLEVSARWYTSGCSAWRARTSRQRLGSRRGPR